MNLKHESDAEQLEARIESVNRKFAEDMRKIEEDQARFLRRLNWWDAFLQGVIWGAVVIFILVFVISLAKHK